MPPKHMLTACALLPIPRAYAALAWMQQSVQTFGRKVRRALGCDGSLRRPGIMSRGTALNARLVLVYAIAEDRRRGGLLQAGQRPH